MYYMVKKGAAVYFPLCDVTVTEGFATFLLIIYPEHVTIRQCCSTAQGWEVRALKTWYTVHCVFAKI